jgi:hypothetical protein
MSAETADEGLDGNPPASKGLGRVHIYGAGIAGLTAAHELARRGFRVRVIEPAQECNERGQLEWPEVPLNRRLAVGGRARTRFFRVEKGARGNFQDAEGERSDEFRLFLEYPTDFAPDDTARRLLPEAALPALRDFLHRGGLITRGEARGVLHIRIPQSGNPRRQDARRNNARALHRYLTAEGDLEVKLDAARVIVMDEAEAEQLEQVLPLPPRRLKDEDGLWLELLHFLPCEHGVRFFPASYRHLLSTLEETPLLDAQGQPTGRRVADNLVPTPFHGVGANGRRLHFVRPPSAAPSQGLMRELEELASSGHPPGDLLQFTLRLWRYMCTSPERRKAEYEKLSWWEYLEGFDPKTGTRRYRYSEAFKRDLRSTPRRLAAVSEPLGDARTSGNALAQLYLQNLRPPARAGGTLNGPTTLAWLRPWRRYLQEVLKVEFRAGTLTRLALDGKERVTPFWLRKGASKEKEDTEVRVTSPGEPFTDVVEPVDYFIVATDAATAEAVTRDLPPLGVIQGLQGFTTKVLPNPRGPELEQPRAPGELPGQVPWDRFQTLTSLQFFFPSPVRLAEGAVCFLDTPWKLSALGGPPSPDTPPTFDREGFGAMLSVDLGPWHPREPGQKRPSDCSQRELAQEVWNQLAQAAGPHPAPRPDAGPYGFAPRAPAWYHVDRALRFAPEGPLGQERAVENRAPDLVPLVGDWERRPGTEPLDPLRPSPGMLTPAIAGLWQAPHGGYPVHWNQLVFAGTYLKTFTRMTSMEAANESARHAVNAILDHCLARRGYPEPPRAQAGGSGMAGRTGGTSGFRMTPLGEYCRIWDPERHELPELAALRELDAKLLAARMPHVWDVLHLEPLAMPLIQPLDPRGGAGALLELLRGLRERLESMRSTHG